MLKTGNQRVLDVLFKEYSSRLFLFSLRFFNHKSDAEEIVQETFVKIWETREKITPDILLHFNAYVITIAKHLIYNRFRHRLVERKYRELQCNTAATSYTIERDITVKQLKEILLNGIAQLPPQQEKILLLKRQGYDNDEIAEQLQLSKRTVETHINKAFKSLRMFFEKRKVQISMLIFTALQ